MIFNILNRYPNMTIDDIELRGIGDDIKITKWNSNEPQPSMNDVWKWIEEDKQKELEEPKLTLKDEIEHAKQDVDTVAEATAILTENSITTADTLANALLEIENLKTEIAVLKGVQK